LIYDGDFVITIVQCQYKSLRLPVQKSLEKSARTIKKSLEKSARDGKKSLEKSADSGNI